MADGAGERPGRLGPVLQSAAMEPETSASTEPQLEPKLAGKQGEKEVTWEYRVEGKILTSRLNLGASCC